MSVTFQAGQIANNLTVWAGISSDPWLLSTVSGVAIPLETLPVQQGEPRPYRLSEQERDIVTREVWTFLKKGVVEPAMVCPGQVVSNVFLRPKKDGSFRMILDLTWLNTHVLYQHFKMHSLQSAIDLMSPGCWMGSIDLRDAYYSVPVCVEHRKFLKFRWQGNLYQFTCLPNGLACAPRIFTKILSPVFAKLREFGVVGFPYIDDSFILAASFAECEQALQQLCNLLSALGFGIHWTKSVLTPTRELTFLGFILNSETMRVFLTQDKAEKLIRAANKILAQEVSTIREVAGLVGLMIAFTTAFDYAGIHVKALEMDKIRALKHARGNFDDFMAISKEGKEDILWWLHNVRSSGRHIRIINPDCTLFTDASEEGWGAHVGDQATGGRWAQEEAQDHINVLELRAIALGLQSFWSGEKHIKVMTDSTTALAYVKNMGGGEIPKLLPGVDNVVADYYSRHFSDNTEWSLDGKIYSKICKVFGEPEIDLFASRLNHKTDVYVSWHPDPQAVAVDAFTMPWTDHFFFAFPPFSCIARTIQKILMEGARGILVTPWWPTQPWWGKLIGLRLRRLQFRKRKDNLRPLGEPANQEFLNNVPLGAFLFSENHC